MKLSILHAALFTPTGPEGMWGLPLLLWGEPGVAKSAIMRQLAREYGLPIEVLSPACRGEGAFGVTPVPVGDRMTYPRPDWTDRFEKARRGVVFVDEINLAAQHYAGALLGLLSDKVLGSYTLPPGVRIMAAANPIEIAAASGGWDLSAPAANRVGHLEWPCMDARVWTDWLLGNELPPEPFSADEEERRVLQLWPEAWGTARGIVAGFLQAHSTHLHAMPKSGGNAVSKAWPSPRTWEYAARALASSLVYGLPTAERDEFVSCFVGEGTGGELMAWYAKATLPNSADLLDGKVKWKHQASKLDVTTAVFSSAVACVTQTREPALQQRRAAAMWALLEQAADDSPDVVVIPAKTLVGRKLFTGLVRVMKALGPVLEAAKIDADAGKTVGEEAA